MVPDGPGGRLAALVLASSRHRFSPEGAGLEVHQSKCSTSLVCLKTEKINFCQRAVIFSGVVNWARVGLEIERGLGWLLRGRPKPRCPCVSIQNRGSEAEATGCLSDFDASSDCDCGTDGRLLVIFSVPV